MAKQARTQYELLGLANWWQEDGSSLINLGVLEVFFAHLDGSKTPQAVVSNRHTPIVEKAFLSFHALVKFAIFPNDPPSQSDAIIKAWPGIFKWSTFFHTVDIQRRDSDSDAKLAAVELVAATWYSISLADGVTPIMAKTPGAIELMTQLFLMEEYPSARFPAAAGMLESLLLRAGGIRNALDRVLATVDGNAETVAQISLSRLRAVLSHPAFSTVAGATTLHIVGVLTQEHGHPLRFAFLHHNVIQEITKAAGTAAKLLKEGGPSSLQAAMVSAFGTLLNCLQSTDGFTWVTSAVQSGLLQAFVDASIFLSKLERPEDRDMIISLLRDILPKYLVYRSIIQVVDGAMRKVTSSPSSHWVDSTPAKDVWRRFKSLASERMRIVKKVAARKGSTFTACDNSKCQKFDYKNNFKKCASCSTSLYCSKECQAIAWKEGGHRSTCKLRVQELLEGKHKSISKADNAFLHLLTIEDIREHIPLFQSLAAKEYPGIPMTRLVACVEYNAAEPEYHLQLLDEYKYRGANNATTRNEYLIKRVRENPSQFCLFESCVASGETAQLVICVISANFWNGDTDDAGDLDGDNMLESEMAKFSQEQPGTESDSALMPMIILTKKS